MTTTSKLIYGFALTVFAGSAIAHNNVNWVDGSGNYAKDGSGDCIRASEWKAGNDCGAGHGKHMDAAPAKPAAAAPMKAPVMKQAEPVKTSPAPQYRQMSLESGASFKLGGSTLSPAGKTAIAELVAKFKGETIKQVIVEGHTDDRGAASFNQSLSEKRANAVKAELIANGIDASVITTKGLGESHPVATNGTREGRAKNRRVEIKVDAAKRQF